jgi:branched-chain amino acid transport system ATP-binding protein
MSSPGATGESPLLVLEHVAVRYGPALAIADVSLELSAGSTLAIVGPNGAGKSSLARAVTGLIPLAAGSVWFGGSEISNLPPHRIRRLGLAYLPEGRGVFGSMTVQENLRMAVRWLSGRTERNSAVDRTIELFPVLGKRRSQLASTLSGGEQQMLALGCELATSPSLIIGDELSLGLAPMIVDELYMYLDGLRNSGVTIVVIEQFVSRAMEIADRIMVLGRGAILWSGSTGEITQEDLVSQYLGGLPAESHG